jgi:PTS system mannose-specific IIB component
VIALARVDDLLVHGQVTAGWVPHLHATVVVVANDRIAADPLLSGIMRSAASGVRIEVLPVGEAARRGARGVWERDAALLLFESLQDAARAIDAGLPVTRLNLGGLRHDEGRLCLCDGVTLDNEDCSLLRALCRRGVSIDVRLMPVDRSHALPSELGGCGA